MDLEAAAQRAASKTPREAFLARVAELRAEFDGLLADDTLALLALDELGLNEGAVVRVADLPGRAEATVVVEIVRVHPAREFAKASGGSGRVVNVDVRDGSGAARLVLWNRDCRHAEEGDLREGRRVKVVNARVKDSRFGIELHAGAWTTFEVEGALDPARRKMLADSGGADPFTERTEATARAEAPAAFAALAALPRDRPAVDVRARLVALSDTRTFQRRDGSVGFVADATLEDVTGRAALVCWDEAVRAVRRLPVGATLTVRDAQVRERDGRVELHAGRTTTLEAA